jgi:hypothetical protein
VTEPSKDSPSSETALVVVAARNDSMQRFVALLLRDTCAEVEFAGTAESIVEALEDDRLRVLVIVSERSGWPGAEVAQTARRRNVSTVFVGHEEPGPGWEFVHSVVQLPFSTSELAERVASALEADGHAPGLKQRVGRPRSRRRPAGSPQCASSRRGARRCPY